MGLSPQINRKSKFTLKRCNSCGQSFGPEGFAPTKSIFYPDGVIPICNDCVDKLIGTELDSLNWNNVNKICQMADIPFVPKEWVRLSEMNNKEVFYRYASIFQSSEYDSLDWQTYNETYKALKDQGTLEEEIPLIDDNRRKALQRKWGGNYDDEALNYLEDLLNGLLNTQNISGKLQFDQALKICKMSYELDRRIAEGGDFKDLLASYDKLVKTAEFTPKNTKNINDFDSFGEVAKYLEKSGWRNTFYDEQSRDIVDETLKNIQASNQRLYVEETGIAEEIARRMEALKTTAEMEHYFTQDNTKQELENYNDIGYSKLMNDIEDEDFKVELNDEDFAGGNNE